MTDAPVNVERSFQRSVMFMVSAASVVLANAEVTWLPAALTPLVAVFSYVFVERRKRIRLPVSVANVLGALAFMAMAWEFSGNTLLGKLLAGAHLLVYITWVVLLLQKGIRQYWWLAALSVLQLAVASVLTTAGAFGASLVVMMALMLWTLSVFTLYRGRIRVAQSIGSDDHNLNAEDSLAEEEDAYESVVTIRNGLQVDSQEPWIGWRFRCIVSFAFAASLLVAIVTFFVFPRVWMPNSPLAGISTPRESLVSQTGFTENVQLGEIGQIMQTEGRVLQFDIKKLRTHEVVSPETFADAMGMDEMLFRGNALGQYEKGGWSIGRKNGHSDGRAIGDDSTQRGFNQNVDDSSLQMHIVQDPPIRKFAFAPAPVSNAFDPSGRIRILRRSLTSGLNFSRRRQDDRVKSDMAVLFDVWFRLPESRPTQHSPNASVGAFGNDDGPLSIVRRSIEGEIDEQRYAYHWCITPEIETALPQLSELANKVCSQEQKTFTQREAIHRIFRYLNSSGKFQYSLTNSIQDPLIDPVEDFLINRRTGHCEYFASAGALMLQSVGVPARVVNGYKGYENNSVSGRSEVKQKHAHTWLEAYIDGHWETLDPTPVAPREEAVSQTSQLAWWKDLTAVLNDSWRDFVQSMSPQRQEAMAKPVLAAIQKKWKDVREQGVWEMLKEFWTEIVLHPELWFSPATGFVTFVVLLLVGLILQRSPIAWCRNKFRDWFHPGGKQERSVVRFYENFRDVCRKHGLPLPAHQTAQENATSVQQHFAAALASENDTGLPHRIATAFNRVRFGQTTLSEADVASLGTDVARLGTLLRSRASE